MESNPETLRDASVRYSLTGFHCSTITILSLHFISFPYIQCPRTLCCLYLQGFPAVLPELDLVEAEDQITHELSLQEECSAETNLGGWEGEGGVEGWRERGRWGVE